MQRIRKLIYSLLLKTILFREYRNSKNANFWYRSLREKRQEDPKYDLSTESYWQYYHDLRISREAFKGKRIIDIGCGPRNSLALFDAEIRIGVDPCIDKCHEKFTKYGLEDLGKHEMLYISCPSENIPLPNRSIDAIVCANALNHVDSPFKTIVEAHRLLKQGGDFHISSDIGGQIKVNEPHPLKVEQLKTWLTGLFDYELRILTDPPEDLNYEYMKYSKRLCSKEKPFMLITAKKL